MDDLYYKKRWEGKPLSFKLKYMYANFPGITFGVFSFLITPIIFGTYYYYSYEGSRSDALKKYKIKYTVVRDDDPKVEKIMAEKEKGRHYFPLC